MKKIISWARQGDFYLESISMDLLPELEKNPIPSMEKYIDPTSLILGLGERTGHKHQIENQEKKATMFKAANMDKFFVIVDEDVKLTHEEHGAIPMPKKRAYEVVRQREDRRGRSVTVAD